MNPEEIHKTRRNLPHWMQKGRVYWITFRQADALDKVSLGAWNAQRELWIRRHPKPWNEVDWAEYDLLFGEKFHEWLDAGYGSCLLARPQIRQLLVTCLMRFEGERLRLHAGVIMPNHVHLLLEPLADHDLSELLKGIKGASSRKIQQALPSSPEAGELPSNPAVPWKFWMDESYDHIVRSEAQYVRLLRYIADNPVKACLAADTFWLYENIPDL